MKKWLVLLLLPGWLCAQHYVGVGGGVAQLSMPRLESLLEEVDKYATTYPSGQGFNNWNGLGWQAQVAYTTQPSRFINIGLVAGLRQWRADANAPNAIRLLITSSRLECHIGFYPLKLGRYAPEGPVQELHVLGTLGLAVWNTSLRRPVAPYLTDDPGYRHSRISLTPGIGLGWNWRWPRSHLYLLPYALAQYYPEVQLGPLPQELIPTLPRTDLSGSAWVVGAGLRVMYRLNDH